MVLPLIFAGLLAASQAAVGTAAIVGLAQNHKKQNDVLYFESFLSYLYLCSMLYVLYNIHNLRVYLHIIFSCLCPSKESRRSNGA